MFLIGGPSTGSLRILSPAFAVGGLVRWTDDRCRIDLEITGWERILSLEMRGRVAVPDVGTNCKQECTPEQLYALALFEQILRRSDNSAVGAINYLCGDMLVCRVVGPKSPAVKALLSARRWANDCIDAACDGSARSLSPSVRKRPRLEYVRRMQPSTWDNSPLRFTGPAIQYAKDWLAKRCATVTDARAAVQTFARTLRVFFVDLDRACPRDDVSPVDDGRSLEDLCADVHALLPRAIVADGKLYDFLALFGG